MTESPSPVAWLVPGQGVDLSGLSTWARCSNVVRARLDHAGRQADCDPVRLLCSGGPRLTQSSVLQPVFVAAVLGIAEVLLQGGLAPGICAGHSLGQLPALAIAGALDFEVAIELAAVRGRIMSAAAREAPGGMLALTADDHELERALSLGRNAGRLWIGGRNGPKRWVLSGDAAALSVLLARFPATRLRVEGAWHCPAMAPAIQPWRSALEQAPIRSPHTTILDGESGRMLSTPAEIRSSLLRQLTQPFDWARTFATLHSADVKRFVAIGPGKMLRDLARENLGRDVRVVGTDSFDLVGTDLGEQAC